VTHPTSPAFEGDPTSPILLLGEAPSFEETREGRPFCGPAGKLLDLCLHSAKIARRECYILNVFPDRVAKKKDDDGAIYSLDGTLLWLKGKFTEAGHEASRGCLDRIAASTANVIVPLGGVALSRTLDTRSISKWRGSIVANADGRKIIPTFHPSYCLKGAYEARHLIISDLTKVQRNSFFPDVRLPRRNILIDPSFDQTIAFLRRCLDASLVDTDIELLGGNVDCFSLAVSPSEAISIPIVDAGFEHRWSPAEEAEIWTLYGRILQSPRIAKINQTLNFDLSCLLQLNNLVPCGPLHDPMVAQSLLLPFIEKSLAMQCSLYTDEPFYKDDGDLHDSRRIEDFQRRWMYNAKDAAVALECWQHLDPLLDEEGLRKTYNDTINGLSGLVYMTVRGLRVDRAALEESKRDTSERIESLKTQLAATFGRPVITEAPKHVAEKRAVAESGAININSPAQLMAYFYGEKKIKPYVNSAGRSTLDERALARIMRRYALPEARLLQEYRSLSKLYGTYLDVEYDEENERVHCSWNSRGTWTGRLSSKAHIIGGKGGGASGFNLQNQPEEMRGFLVSDDIT
jgi:DNA polymerase